LSGQDLFIPLAECRLYAPVRGSKIVAIGRNYPEYTKNEGKRAGKVPACFIKVPSSIVGPGATF
jgi:2-keto-4-pentenoate hydratase/2-oxohepta-3-ene-1,7-dioic acid hydratase in catechol pathway